MELLCDGPDDAPVTIVLAHGAGLGMDAPFMTRVAKGLAAGGHRVVRFEFPYMAQRRATGKRGPPNRAPILLDSFRDAISASHAMGPLVLAGKSMGGRMATMMAQDADAAAVLVYGYPFHPPTKPDKLRTEHLRDLTVPTLICQGERDPFGTAEEVPGFGLSKAIELCWLPDGDHDFKPRKASGHTHDGNIAMALDASLGFLKRLER